jgi:hypothetical protein
MGQPDRPILGGWCPPGRVSLRTWLGAEEEYWRNKKAPLGGGALFVSLGSGRGYKTPRQGRIMTRISTAVRLWFNMALRVSFSKLKGSIAPGKIRVKRFSAGRRTGEGTGPQYGISMTGRGRRATVSYHILHVSKER